MKPTGTRSQHPKKRIGKKPPNPEQMDALLHECGIRLASNQLKQLWRYHQLLRQYDTELNLTRIHNFENMVVKLYADSILPAIHHPNLPSPLLDLGSGPGMPGIPLAIFRPDLKVLLADSRKQRTDFLKTVVSEMSLTGIEVVERGIAPDFDRPVAGVITRAVEPIAATLSRVAGCLTQNGSVLFMKGPGCDEEIQAAQTVPGDYELTDDIAYRIPHTPHQRRLVVFRCKAPPKPTVEAVSKHRIRIIESESNAVFKALKKLHSGRGIKKAGRTLVCGQRLTDEVLDASPQRCRSWISQGDHTPPPQKAPAEMDWIQLSTDLFQILDLFGTRKPMVLFEFPEPRDWDPEEDTPIGCSLLVPFQDPDNVGAVIRTAAAMDVNRIILLAESANPFHPKAVRASAGTVFSAPLIQGPSLLDLPENLTVIALSSTGKPLARTPFPASFYLLTGMEGPGLPPQWRANSVAIPMNSGVESLNAAVSTAIALYEWKRSFE